MQANTLLSPVHVAMMMAPFQVDVLSTCTVLKAATARPRRSALNMTQSTAKLTHADWAMLVRRDKIL